MKRVFLALTLLGAQAFSQWDHIPDIPSNRTVYSLLAVHDTLYAGTDSSVYVGTHDGTTWKAGAAPVTSPDAVSCLLKTGNVLLAGTLQSGVFKSTNDGQSWQPFSTGLVGLGATDISSLLIRRDSLIVGTLGAAVFTTSSDFAHPWTAWGDSLSDYEGDNVFKMMVVGNTVLAGAGANGYMFRYTDAQPWWNPVPLNMPRRIGQSVIGMGRSTSAAFAGTNDGIYRSTDAGISWQRQSPALPPFTVQIHLPFSGTTMFALATTPVSSTLFSTMDEGATWVNLGAVPVPDVLAAAIIGDTFFASNPDGLWRAKVSRLTTGVTTQETAGSFSLQQNYPNPFNPSTEIEFSIARAGFVTLKVFNVLGQEVQTLVSETVQPGTYRRIFDGRGLSSGVYFFRLESAGLSQTRRLLLLR